MRVQTQLLHIISEFTGFLRLTGYQVQKNIKKRIASNENAIV